jgi:hypothetical protein
VSALILAFCDRSTVPLPLDTLPPFPSNANSSVPTLLLETDRTHTDALRGLLESTPILLSVVCWLLIGAEYFSGAHTSDRVLLRRGETPFSLLCKAREAN